MAAPRSASPALTRDISSRPTRSPMRRRQRSVRVSVAVALLTVGTALVVVTIPTQSVFWLSTGSVAGMVLAWAALRIMWTEVLQSRRENAADRAAAAAAYRDLFTARAAEHAEFTSAMTERLAEAQLSKRELEGLVARAGDRAREAERALLAESESLAGARDRIDELERALRPAEDALAIWESDGHDPAALAEWGAWAARKAAPSERALKQA